MRTLTVLLAVLLFYSVGTANPKDDITKELLTSNGQTRAYYLYIPPTINSSAPAPLIVLLHGSNRRGISLVEKWKDLAKKEGVILAGPDSLDTRFWNAPKDGPDPLRDLIEELKKKYPINPRRVYLFGHSAGASFALQLSLMESEYFAATAIHAGALVDNVETLISLAQRKIPFSIQVGDSDQYFPLKIVRATRDSLKDAGFSVELTEIPNHDHWYYDSAAKINSAAWAFLKKYQLEVEPKYQSYKW